MERHPLQGRVITTIDRVDPETVAAFQQFYTGIVLDTLGKHGAMHVDIAPLSPGMKLCGPAVTALGPDLTVRRMALDLAEPGDVLVVAAGDVRDYACFGDGTASRMLRKSLAGAVIDGATRDAAGLRALGFPTFSRGVTARNYHYPAYGDHGAVNVPVVCGGTVVEPGDLILGDDDGIVVVPRAVAPRIRDVVAAKLADERSLRSGWTAGVRMTTAYESSTLAGRVAVVTGAGGGGSGEAIARTLAGQGATVVMNGLPRHEKTLSRVASQNPNLSYELADVGVENQASALVAKVAARHGRADILVHNAAGSRPYQAVDELDTTSWRDDLATILDGGFFLTRAAAPYMRAAGFGRIVFVSSSAAFRGARGRSAAYAAAKAGLHGLVVQLALELGPFGITANAVAPSQLDTPRVRRGGRRDDTSMRQYARSIPAGRPGNAADVAGVVAFLASTQARYLTGQVIRLDGGSALASPATNPVNGVRPS